MCVSFILKNNWLICVLIHPFNFSDYNYKSWFRTKAEMASVDNGCSRLGCTEIVVGEELYCDGCEAYNRGPEMQALEKLLCSYPPPLSESMFPVVPMWHKLTFG